MRSLVAVRDFAQGLLGLCGFSHNLEQKTKTQGFANRPKVDGSDQERR